MRKIIDIRDKVFGVDKNRTNAEKEVAKAMDLDKFNFRELKAMEVLKPYFPDGYLFETSFSLSFQTIQHLLNDIIFKRPKIVLEFGSGLSSLILDNFIRKEKLDVKVISVDDNKPWQEFLSSKVEHVEFFHFPIKEENKYSHNQDKNWFGIPDDHPIHQYHFDLVVVDAPKWSNCKYSRYGFVPFLEGKIDEKSIIYLDDAHRGDETKILEWFKEKYPQFTQFQHFYKYCRISVDEDFFTFPS